MLLWREARREDRRSLQQFTCTTPKPTGRNYRLPHPFPWELDVQNHIRDLKPPAAGSIQLGWSGDTGELAAVVWWKDPETAGEYDIVALAVSVAFRGQGCGDLAMEHALAVMEFEAGAAGATTLNVLAFRDGRNDKSKQLLERHGFLLADGQEKPEPWMLDKPVAKPWCDLPGPSHPEEKRVSCD